MVVPASTLTRARHIALQQGLQYVYTGNVHDTRGGTTFCRDCGEALIITTAERARDLDVRPVHVHAMALGGTRVGEFYENSLDWTENAFWVALQGL